MTILGISCYYHDSAASLIIDGEIVASVQEERFTRKKHDPSFPVNSIKYCLSFAKINLSDVDKITFYEDPSLKYSRLIKTYKDFFPKSISLIFKTFYNWSTKKRFWKKVLIKEFKKNFNKELSDSLFYNTEHHLSHAASAFYPSKFSQSAILVMDGVGEFATTSIWKGYKNNLKLIKQIDFPHSIGLLYSAITYYTGFRVNSGEYKVMGLAPYGRPVYKEKILKNLININSDGSYELNMDYFSFPYSDYMTNEKFNNLFGGPAREPETIVTQKEMDLARSVQEVVEEVVIKLSKYALKVCETDNLCLAGGVALNCVANGKISKEVTENIWIQPAAGDAGGALGSALHFYYNVLENNLPKKEIDLMKGSYLGPSFSNSETKIELDNLKAQYTKYDFLELKEIVSDFLSEGKVIGWFQGRMEFGPRALGNRSIIGDARNSEMQKIMNLKIKFRESFRPFAPSILDYKSSEYFNLDITSPYMLLVTDIKENLKIPVKNEGLFGIDKLNQVRSKLPAITHVDYSARVQTVHEETNKRYYDLIETFYKKTGSPVLINTSFNVRGEPIVCSIEDAYTCFMRTEMDILVINDFVLIKKDQPQFEDKEKWQKTYELD